MKRRMIQTGLVKRMAAVVLVFLFSMGAKASKSDSLLHQLQEMVSPQAGYRNYFEFNPAATVFVASTDINSLSATYGRSQAYDKFHLVRNGDQTSATGLQSESFQTGKQFSFFGKAAWGSGQKQNTGWNNVEDYDLLAPYVIADSVGGDYYRESYFLEGGFALHRNGFDWGFRGSYSGSVSYRQVDPRPKNTVSVIRINPGVLYSGSSFRAGIFGEYSRYRQNVDIAIEKSDRKIYFYLLQGFGTYNRQFSFLGESMTRIYRGNSASGGFLLNQTGRQRGFIFNLQRAMIQVQESDRRIPYRINHTIASISATNDFIVRRRTLLLKADYLFGQTIGNETQYMPSVINTSFTVWTPVTSSDRYQARNQQATVSALLTCNKPSGLTWWQELKLGINSDNSYYYSPDYRCSTENVTAAFTLGANVGCGRSLFSVSATGGCVRVVRSSLNLNENNSVISHQFMPDFRYLSSDRLFCGTELKCSFGVSQSLLASIVASGGLQKQLAGDGKSIATALTMSLVF